MPRVLAGPAPVPCQDSCRPAARWSASGGARPASRPARPRHFATPVWAARPTFHGRSAGRCALEGGGGVAGEGRGASSELPPATPHHKPVGRTACPGQRPVHNPRCAVVRYRPTRYSIEPYTCWIELGSMANPGSQTRLARWTD